MGHRRDALPPKATIFVATLAAPPARYSSRPTTTTGTGASGERREAPPQT